MNFNPILLSIKIKPDIILDMVKVETEPFFIGGENGSFDGMKCLVNIEKDFYISKFEITQKQWAAIMQSPAPTKYPGPNRPLDEVSLEDAMNFCNKISQITGLTFTLPTEAQWEFAAKGGNIVKDIYLQEEIILNFYFPKMRLMMVIKVLHMMLDYFPQMN